MKQKKQVPVMLLVLFTLIVLGVNNYPFIKHNGAGSGYGGGGEGTGEGSSIKSSECHSIEYYIMKGGTYYLEANSHIQALLKLVEQKELYGIDYYRVQLEVYYASINMQRAKQTYERLIDAAESTPYNPVFQARLSAFDYDTFGQEMGFNPVLFDLVRQHLQNGDITGLFKRTYTDMTVMIDLLNRIRDSVYQYRVPLISIFRQLNEQQALTSVFGSYAAGVFQEINQK